MQTAQTTKKKGNKKKPGSGQTGDSKVPFKREPATNQPTNRMHQYKDINHYIKIADCPECKTQPVVCTYRGISSGSFYCKGCGHRWEV
jgi:hypothetical protein